jgi:hypothetical protein
VLEGRGDPAVKGLRRRGDVVELARADELPLLDEFGEERRGEQGAPVG